MDKILMHSQICKKLTDLYAKKNHDYGDSFAISFREEGMAMPRIRIGDKFNRFKSLTRGEKQMISDESVKDTLMDMANYAIMTLIEMEEQK